MSSSKKLHECDFPGCGKAFPKLWRLREHQCSAHTGEVRRKALCGMNTSTAFTVIVYK